MPTGVKWLLAGLAVAALILVFKPSKKAHPKKADLISPPVIVRVL